MLLIVAARAAAQGGDGSLRGTIKDVLRHEGNLLRAGANFQVDITMALGALQETVTVSGDSPMIEVSRHSTN